MSAKTAKVYNNNTGNARQLLTDRIPTNECMSSMDLN